MQHWLGGHLKSMFAQDSRVLNPPPPLPPCLPFFVLSKLCKVKRAGDRMPSLTGLIIMISFIMVCLIFHTAIIINRKNWRITIKLYFEKLSIFLKNERTHMLGPPPPFPLFVFCSLFSDLYFLNDPLRRCL